MEIPEMKKVSEPSEDVLSEELVSIVRSLAAKTSQTTYNADSNVYTDFDLDSLKVLELAEIVKGRYGVDLLSNPEAFRIMSSPRTIAKELSGINRV